MTDRPLVHLVPERLSDSPLVRDYLAQQGEAPAFFAGSPHDLASYRRKLEEVARRFGPDERARAAEAVRPGSDRARARLESFVARGGAMVTTGQQAGLFTGPLYTIHKALSTARLADYLQRALEIPVVPVFWVASEDHDWEEVNHVFFNLPQDGVLRLDLHAERSRARPMGEQPLGPDIIRVLDEVSELLSPQPFGGELITLLRVTCSPERTMAEAFSGVLERLLSRYDLCFTDAANPAVKRVSTPLLERALVESEEQIELLRRRGAELEGSGYATQVSVLPGATNVFYHGAGGRVRLYRDGEGWMAPETGTRFRRAELLDELRATPALFSPNVLLRPVVESAVFPTLAYVGGPGEISYFAQAAALFSAYEISPPVAYPRGSLTIVEAPMQRLLEKLGFTLAELARPEHELVEELARRALPEEVITAVDELGRRVTEGYGRLIEIAGGIDPTLTDALSSLRNQVLAKIGDSERKVIRQLKRREEITVGQLERVRGSLRPEGKPQDRVLNVLPFVARHGFGLLDDIAEVLHPAMK